MLGEDSQISAVPEVIGDGRQVARRRVVIHEWVEAIGGSEAVTIEILEALPDSEFMSLWVADAALNRLPPGKQTVLRRLPGPGRKALALGLTPFTWRATSSPRYDTVITSTHAMGHTARLPSSRKALYLSYVHSPARYIYSPELDPRGSKRWMAPASAVLAGIDRRMSKHVFAYACNSNEVRCRVQQFWGREATVIPPPVDVDFFSQIARNPQGYLLSVGRLISYKRHDFAIRLGEASGSPVVIIGTGPLEAELRARARIATVPVSVVTTDVRGAGQPTREQIREAMAGARVLVFAGHEDFGIVPVEAQAAGLPVLGIDAGGLRDSVINGTTGVLIASDEPREFAEALPVLDTLSEQAIREHAQGFSAGVFRQRFREWVLEQEADHSRTQGLHR